MEFITLNKDNLQSEHICCAISDKKGESCVSSKKEWLSHRFNDGLIFTKLNIRGKVFIEYIPAENAWCPIIAPNCIFINCLWVAGAFKGNGYGCKLLYDCIENAKRQGKSGVVVLASKKKMPFLSDKKFFLHNGFRVCDSAEPYFELMFLPLQQSADIPSFKACAKQGVTEEQGLVLYYTHQCPHTAKYAPLAQLAAKERGVNLKLIHIASVRKAQNAPSPFTTYSLFYNGKFITNEILSQDKIKRLIDEYNICPFL